MNKIKEATIYKWQGRREILVKGAVFNFTILFLDRASKVMVFIENVDDFRIIERVTLNNAIIHNIKSAIRLEVRLSIENNLEILTT